MYVVCLHIFVLFFKMSVCQNKIRSGFNGDAEEWWCGACFEANSRSVTTFSTLKQCINFDFDLHYTRILLTIQKLCLESTQHQKINRGFIKAITKDSRACDRHKCSSCQGCRSVFLEICLDGSVCVCVCVCECV